MQRTLAALIAAAVLTAPPAWAQGQADRLAAADTNHDGSITRAELQAMRAAGFDRLDANHDGALGAEERATAGEGMARQLNADANNDGVVTRAEFLAQPPRAFERFDANHNDVLEPSELAALRSMAARFGR